VLKYALLLGLLLATSANALTITWVAPTTREDGSALLASEIASYRVVWTINGVAQPGFDIPGNVLTYNVVETTKGKYCFTLYTHDTAGLESAASNTSCRNASPKPPSGVSVR
jgi:hypothetical protein